MAPMYSLGARIRAFTYGSSMRSTVDPCGMTRVFHHLHRAVGLVDVVLDVGDGGDEVEIEFPLQPLAHDLHVQETQEAAAEAEAQRDRCLRLVVQRAVVELHYEPETSVALGFGFRCGFLGLLHMEIQEAAAEAEAQRDRCLRLV